MLASLVTRWDSDCLNIAARRTADCSYTAVCFGDALLAHCVNSQIALDLDGTIME
jgi:hypothetical protein